MKSVAFFLAFSVAATAEEVLPQPYSKDRYAETIGKSPFVLETKAEAPTVEKINPFQNLFLRGIDKTDGVDYVLVQRLGEERPMRFAGTQPGPDGISVQAVRIGNTYKETRVVLKKDAEIGEIGFKEDTLNSPPPAATGPARPPAMPGQFPKTGGLPMPQGIPAARPPQPSAIAQPVPRPGGSVPMPQAAPVPRVVPQTPGAPNGVRLRNQPIKS